MQPPDRKEFLERMVMGLEQTVGNMSAEISYYKPDTLEYKYARKFLEAAQANLAKAKTELEGLSRTPPPPEGGKGSA